jgi:hypothetical protein
MHHANHCDRCNGSLAVSMMSNSTRISSAPIVRTTSAKRLATPQRMPPNLPQ